MPLPLHILVLPLLLLLYPLPVPSSLLFPFLLFLSSSSWFPLYFPQFLSPFSSSPLPSTLLHPLSFSLPFFSPLYLDSSPPLFSSFSSSPLYIPFTATCTSFSIFFSLSSFSSLLLPLFLFLSSSASLPFLLLLNPTLLTLLPLLLSVSLSLSSSFRTPPLSVFLSSCSSPPSCPSSSTLPPYLSSRSFSSCSFLLFSPAFP